jgi:hypothetical protein
VDIDFLGTVLQHIKAVTYQLLIWCRFQASLPILKCIAFGIDCIGATLM